MQVRSRVVDGEEMREPARQSTEVGFQVADRSGDAGERRNG